MKSKIPGTERIAFSGEGARERAMDEFRRLRREGYKGVTRYTDQNVNQMIYIVAWPRAEEQTKILDAVNKMVDEGGPSTDVPLTAEGKPVKVVE